MEASVIKKQIISTFIPCIEKVIHSLPTYKKKQLSLKQNSTAKQKINFGHFANLKMCFFFSGMHHRSEQYHKLDFGFLVVLAYHAIKG